MIIGALMPEAYKGAPFALQPVGSPAQLSLKWGWGSHREDKALRSPEVCS